MHEITFGNGQMDMLAELIRGLEAYGMRYKVQQFEADHKLFIMVRWAK